jgi:two-component system, OmpR family, phosphate regulon sensor histidine kinase PhoR
MFFAKRKKQADELASCLKDAEEKSLKLENENKRMQAILNSMIEGVIAVDRDTRVLSVNPTIEKIFDVPRGNILGKFFLEAFRNNDISEIINAVLSNGEFISKELSLVWPLQKIFQVNASPIFEKDTVSGCLLVIHDITEIRRLETMRRDFVANVSHELKTPLTSIKGFVETLSEGALEDKEHSRQFLSIIQEHTDRLDSLINDLLDLSHIESGELRLRIEDLRFKNIVDYILPGFKSQLNKKKLNVENNISAALVVKADKAKINQVLTNLIDNAIKFNNDKGSIKIYNDLFNSQDRIVVEDSGQGIPPKDLTRIFERFYRVDKARSRELGGTGLGLSIVKHIVELHGGSVGVESTEGLGSKFWFTLPK